MDGAQGCRWLGLADGNGGTLGHTDLGEGLLRQPQFVGADDATVVHHVEDRQHRHGVWSGEDLHLIQGLKAFAAIMGAVPVEEGYVLAVGIDGDPP